jgi:predicted  nucleic acid-binding Zn-ribbon protein
MRLTDKLLRVYRVDRQLAGLQSRLKGAERFLQDQTSQIDTVESKRQGLEKQHKQTRATIADHEGEMARIDVVIATKREQMNSTKTNKEYKALLTEVNTLKADRDRAESSALELMTKADDLAAQLGELDKQREGKGKVRQVAAEDRDRKAAEIKDRLAELQAERVKLAADVPPSALAAYEELVRQKDEEAMAPLEEQDRKRHEYNCGSCMMAVPVETVSALLSHGSLTRCSSCGCILYIETETAESFHNDKNGGKGGKSSGKRAGKSGGKAPPIGASSEK